MQEAVSNVCRHAAASHVKLSARIDGNGGIAPALVVTLEDDGLGFDADARGKRQGRGLSNIRSRASIIEAEVTWQKGPGGGTLFTMRKPLSILVS